MTAIFLEGLPRPLAELAVPSRPSLSRAGAGEGHHALHSRPVRAGAAGGYSCALTAFSVFEEVLECLGQPGRDSLGNKRETELCERPRPLLL